MNSKNIEHNKEKENFNNLAANHPLKILSNTPILGKLFTPLALKFSNIDPDSSLNYDK